MSTCYRGSCASCGVSHHNKKFKNVRGYPIPENIVPTDLKYFSVENNRLCGGCKTSIYKSTKSFKQISLVENTTKFSNYSISSTNQNNQENVIILSNKNENNEEKLNIKFKENCVDEEKKVNKIENDTDIIYGLKPACYGCGKCDIELKIVTVGRADSEYSPFGRWFCCSCIPVMNKKYDSKQKRKLIDYSISSESTKQKRRKKLRDTTNLLAASETSVPELVDDVFNVYKAEEKILSENILRTMQVIQQHFNPVEYKSIGCLLTDNISLDRASQLTGITKRNISRYRNLECRNKIFKKFEKKKFNENFEIVLNAWGDVNVMTTSGKSQKPNASKMLE